MSKTAIALAAVAAATSVDAYATYPDFCRSSELTKFTPLLITNGNDIMACQTASGWAFIPPTTEPTAAQEARMCNNQNCKNLLAAIQKLSPADCFLSLSNDQQGVNVKILMHQLGPFCAVFGSTA